jgi:hypothetical protein
VAEDHERGHLEDEPEQEVGSLEGLHPLRIWRRHPVEDGPAHGNHAVDLDWDALGANRFNDDACATALTSWTAWTAADGRRSASRRRVGIGGKAVALIGVAADAPAGPPSDRGGIGNKEGS